MNTFTVICFLSPPEIATEKVKQYHTDFFVVVALDFFFYRNISDCNVKFINIIDNIF